MRLRNLAALLLILLIAAAPDTSTSTAATSAALKMPHDDIGACPFECCTYREWVAKKATGVRRERSESAPTVTSVQLGETVVALTGVVVTERPGRATVVDPDEVRSDISGVSLEVRPEDPIFLLHYQGEGMWLAWSSGTRFSIFVRQNPGSFYAGETPPDSLRVDSWPDTKWWVHIRTPTGKEGWTDQPDHFDGKDACS